MIRMLVIGYCFGIRSERRLCEEVQLNLAYRWFCRLGLENSIPDHSTFSKNRHGRLRESDTFRHVFETVLRRCMTEGLVGGEGFAVDASVVRADANRARGVPGTKAIDWKRGMHCTRAVREYVAALEQTATRTMIDHVEAQFDLKPTRLIGDMAYGSAKLLNWIVNEKAIEPHVPVWDKTQRKDETFSSREFQWEERADEYRCPQGHALRSQWRAFQNPRSHITKADTIIYRSSQFDCASCPMKARCCPNAPFRKIIRSAHESARDVARTIAKTDAYKQSRKDRKKVEMLFAHLKRIMKLDRLRLRGLSGANDEFLLAAVAQNLRRMAKRVMPRAENGAMLAA
jgi:IS5 family transposase